jgi:DMSO/TMAO reductase YedYZ molybdopterin-dependent catalytic subunit
MSISRRKLITTGFVAAGGVAGLDVAARLARKYGLVPPGLIPPDYGGIYGPGETLTYAAQRLLTRRSRAREFPRSYISQTPYADEIGPLGPAFDELKAGGWRLSVDGMVARPRSFSLAELRSYPSSSQITEVICEEGWSYIAEWTGVPLGLVLDAVGVFPLARYLVYFSIDRGWWDSMDMSDALHPQTILAYGMNGGELPVEFGGPLRMRLPRQLGYKNVKFITRLTLADSMKKFGKGLGAAGSEQGYAWYAGI